MCENGASITVVRTTRKRLSTGLIAAPWFGTVCIDKDFSWEPDRGLFKLVAGGMSLVRLEIGGESVADLTLRVRLRMFGVLLYRSNGRAVCFWR